MSTYYENESEYNLRDELKTLFPDSEIDFDCIDLADLELMVIDMERTLDLLEQFRCDALSLD